MVAHAWRDQEDPRTQNILRATPIIARSMYLELVRAQYSQADVVRFVNKMLEYARNHEEHSKAEGRASQFIDLETGLPDTTATRSILAFECRRAATNGRKGLVVGVIDAPELPVEQHPRLARLLWQNARSTDALGRIDADRYLLLPDAQGERALDEFQKRLAVKLKEDKTWSKLQVTLQRATWTQGDSAEQLITRCLDARAVPVVARTPTATEAPGVVLALGGGAARAAAHVGVLRSLLDSGVKIRAVAGTSGGALVGAMWAAGMEPEQIVQRFEAFASSSLLRAMRKAYVAARRDQRQGRLEGSIATVPQALYEEMMTFLTGADRDIASLRVPFSATAADLVAGHVVELSRGSLHVALRASCAIPRLFPVQRVRNRVFVDGATLSEVPNVRSLPRPPGTRVLSVYLSRPTTSEARYDTPDEIMARMAALTQAELLRANLGASENLLSIPVEEYGWLGFRNARALADVGETAASRSIPRLLMREG